MDRLKIITALSLFINFTIFAQSNTAFDKGSEICRLTTNATTFINGEQLLYVVNCLPGTAMQKLTSKIAYIELIDNQKKSTFKQKLFLNNGKGSGYFTLPMTLQTGDYKLIAYTNRMFVANEATTESVAITIINPYVAVHSNEKIKTTNDPINPIANRSSATFLEEKKEFSNRQKINFDLKNLLTNLNTSSFSVSVRKIDELDQHFFGTSQVVHPTSKIASNSNVISELRGEIISGKITAKTPSFTIENKNISLSFPGFTNTVKIVKTNYKGEFYFLLEKAYYSNNAIIQCIDGDKENYKIELNNNVTDFSSVQFPSELVLPTSLKNSIDNRLVASQIENSYFEKKQDSIRKTNASTPFYALYAKEYKLDDYTRFPTLQETIIEFIEGLSLKKRKENYQLYLSDTDKNDDLEVPCLVLVDGLYIQDIKELMSYKAEIFDAIKTVKGGYFYGTKLYNGIIEFTTKEYNYETKLTGDYIIRPELLRPLSEKIIYNPKYNANSDLTKIPDYRYQLYWEPNYTNSNQPITFYTSDIDGTFEIKIEGFDSNNEYFKQTQFFEVK